MFRAHLPLGLQIEELDFSKFDGLKENILSATIVDFKTSKVLVQGYQNKAALEKTLVTGEVFFWSRKRKGLWHKGEKSGETLLVKKIEVDCDKDALLIYVKRGSRLSQWYLVVFR